MTSTILDTGKAYFIYSTTDNAAKTAGFATAMLQSDAGTFGPTDGLIYNYGGRGTNKANVTGKYEANQWLLPMVIVGLAPPLSFDTPQRYNATYDQAPTLQAVKGNYRGIATTTSQELTFANAKTIQSVAPFTIDDAGLISGMAGQCPFTGTVIPRQNGNVFDASIAFANGAGCANPNTTAAGVAFIDISGQFFQAMLETPPYASVLIEAGKR